MDGGHRQSGSSAIRRRSRWSLPLLDRTQQQTLTQIDFVSVYTPHADVDLDFMEADEPPTRKRRRLSPDNSPPQGLDLGRTGRMGAPTARSQPVKREPPSTPPRAVKFEIPSSQSPRESVSPTQRESPSRNTASVLTDISTNIRRGFTSGPTTGRSDGGSCLKGIVLPMKREEGQSGVQPRHQVRKRKDPGLPNLVIADSEDESEDDDEDDGDGDVDEHLGNGHPTVSADPKIDPDTQTPRWPHISLNEAIEGEVPSSMTESEQASWQLDGDMHRFTQHQHVHPEDSGSSSFEHEHEYTTLDMASAPALRPSQISTQGTAPSSVLHESGLSSPHTHSGISSSSHTHSDPSFSPHTNAQRNDTCTRTPVKRTSLPSRDIPSPINESQLLPESLLDSLLPLPPCLTQDTEDGDDAL